jgi:prepilin-type N-terminal cleavage/methylation domain-containing protein
VNKVAGSTPGRNDPVIGERRILKERSMTSAKRTNHSGFSLIELVIVVVIIAIIGAIAIPRMSRGAAGASDSALVGDVAVLRNAVDLYATEHGGTFPGGTTVVDQLTSFTDAAGAVSATKDATHIFGPYLRKLPPLPVGTNKGETAIANGATATLGATGSAWFYDPATGEIKANLAATEKDTSNKSYSDY